MRAYQQSPDEMKILKDSSAKTTAIVVSVTYRLWLSFSIDGVLDLTKSWSVIQNQCTENSFLLFERSSAHFKLRKDPEGPQCSNYCQSSDRSVLLVATILEQESAQLNKVKERNIRSICRQQLCDSLRAHLYSSHQKETLKDQRAQATARVVSIPHRLWLPLSIKRVLNFTDLSNVIYYQSADNKCFAL